jgi:uncharacterized protein Smg (DUF494 family)
VIEILQLLFATAKDQNLYINKQHLIQELLTEYEFTPTEIQEAIEWFNPVINRVKGLEINPAAVRSLSRFEEKYLPASIINQIIEWEQNKTINLVEREILLDRLAELSGDWRVEADDLQPILEGLVYHLQHYKYNLVSSEFALSGYYWANNFTVH